MKNTLSRIEDTNNKIAKILGHGHWEVCDCDLGEAGLHHCPVDIFYPKLTKLFRHQILDLIKGIKAEIPMYKMTDRFGLMKEIRIKEIEQFGKSEADFGAGYNSAIKDVTAILDNYKKEIQK